MGRSITVRPSPPAASFFHQASDRHYRVDGNRMRRHQVDASGAEINVIEKTVDVAVGSGNHAITYLTKTAQNRLLELPLSWYSKTRAWAMSPGYDREDHEDFRREISDSCLFCHSGSSEPTPISCERCHGPSELHLQTPSRATIVNPAKLPPDRQLEICLQCHLQTTSSGIQDSVRRPGRSAWSFRPGEALSSYKMLFDRTDEKDRLEINHAGYRLLQSACFRGSSGKLQCTTCHDPHTATLRPNACNGCHANTHRENAAMAGKSCESCHMAKRAPTDAVHTQVTDHKISRRPDRTNATVEDHSSYTGPVVAFYMAADEFTLQAVNRSNDPSVYRRMVERDPKNAALLALLGKVLLRRQDTEAALPVLERATVLDPACTDCFTHLAVAKALSGHPRQALELLQRALRGNPDHVLSWINLGIAYEALKNPAEARKAYVEAVRLQPDSVEAKRRLARLQL